jgi:hypothetical protein
MLRILARTNMIGLRHWLIGLPALFLIIPFIFLAITIYLAVWIYRDAERRGAEPAIWLLIFLVANIQGLIIWLLVRPDEERTPTR